eukprot:1150280-Pelagomonas_calceolata.AAC.1
MKSKTRNMLYCIAIALRCVNFAVELRRKYKDLFVDLSKPLHTFARLPITDFIPFLASFHIITNPEVQRVHLLCSLRAAHSHEGCKEDSKARSMLYSFVLAFLSVQCSTSTPGSEENAPAECAGGPGHTAAAIGPGTVWVWGGTGCASQGDSSPGQTW